MCVCRFQHPSKKLIVSKAVRFWRAASGIGPVFMYDYLLKNQYVRHCRDVFEAGTSVPASQYEKGDEP